MDNDSKPKGLTKELNLLSVYALATGATLSSGFFLLPGIAFSKAGPAVVLCYMLALLPLIPAMFSMVELATAMPRAGGAYYFLDRSMGPLVGTIGGIGTWLALILKTTFALIGMGAYVNLFYADVPYTLIAAGLAVLFALANLTGTKKAGSVQIALVIGLLGILTWFMITGVPHTNMAHFDNFLGSGHDAILATTGMVFLSYVGVTKVASVAEEVKDPERNLPLGVFLAMATAAVVYGVGTFVIVGLVPASELAPTGHHNYTPVASAASALAGDMGIKLITVAAMLAFFAVANAGILAASRYPLAMSRDKLLPPDLKKLNSKNIPVNGVLATLFMILLILALFDVEKIAKLASAFQLLLFGALCVAVIVMRESGLASYDPGCKSPLYPWMQILGVIMPLCLIPMMGALSTLFSIGLIIVGVTWYRIYGRQRVTRHGAIFHVFARLGQRREAGLDAELRGILKEKGLRVQDPFDELIIAADVLDVRDDLTFEQVTKLAAKRLERVVPASAEKLVTDIMENTGLGATPVSHGAALPHLRLDNLESPRMVLVRSRRGIRIDMEALIPGSEDADAPIHAIFFLISPTNDPGRHLRVLAQLATHIDSDHFSSEWLSARDDHDLKQVLLHDERMLAIELHKNKPSGAFIGKPIRDIKLPEACLVALIRRGDQSIIPRGHTLLEEGDWLTILGEGPAIKELSRLMTETLDDK